MVYLIIFLTLCACNDTSPPPLTKKDTYQGRYHAEVPFHWKRINPSEDLSDSRIPICSYEMEEGLLTIHMFPYTSIEQRIPPEAQIERWKRQTGECGVTPFSYGGFGGFRLESADMIAYAMQLSPPLFRCCSTSDMKADYTLKFVGAVDKNREEINAFAESFEWIQPLLYENL